MRTNRPIWLRLISIGLVALLLVTGLSTAVAAATMTEGSIGPDEVVDDDLFIAGEQVTMAGTVRGDAFVMGGEVDVSGTVEGSLFVFSGNATVSGDVQGSVYLFTSSTHLSDGVTVERNAYFGGFDLEVSPGASIAKDLLIGGYQVEMDGAVGGSLRGGMGALDLAGSVREDVDIGIAPPGQQPVMFAPASPYGPPPARPTGLRVAPTAEIGGMLRYESEQRQDDAIRAQPGGGVQFQRVIPEQRQEEQQPTGARAVLLAILRWIVKRLRELITLAILGALTVWLTPRWLERSREVVKEEPWPSLGWGVLAWIAGFVVAGVVFFALLAVGILLGVVTLGGLARAWFGIGFSVLGLYFSSFLLIVAYCSKLVLAYWVGRAIFGKRYEGAAYWPLLVGILIYVVLRGIPFVGWIFGLIVTFFGLGALWTVSREMWKRWRPRVKVELEEPGPGSPEA